MYIAKPSLACSQLLKCKQYNLPLYIFAWFVAQPCCNSFRHWSNDHPFELHPSTMKLDALLQLFFGLLMALLAILGLCFKYKFEIRGNNLKDSLTVQHRVIGWWNVACLIRRRRPPPMLPLHVPNTCFRENNRQHHYWIALNFNRGHTRQSDRWKS